MIGPKDKIITDSCEEEEYFEDEDLEVLSKTDLFRSEDADFIQMIDSFEDESVNLLFDPS